MTAISRTAERAAHKVVEFETERLLIRRFDLSDDAFVLRLLNEESFLRFIGDKCVRTLEDARDYLCNGPMASYAAHGYGLYLVAEKTGGDAVGMCGLLRRDGQEHPDIGFAFLLEHQAKGFAYESAVAVMKFGHDQLKIEIIVAFVSPDNYRSIRLLERIGLSFAGAGNLGGIATLQSMYRSDRQS